MSATQDPFERSIAFTLLEEGGYSDAVGDAGGPTNYGITLKTLRAWRAPATVIAYDVRTLTVAEATDIYRTWYWLQPRCDDLPAGVDLMVFDFGVNAGQVTSVEMMQQVVGASPDGVIGPKTLARVGAVSGANLIDQLATAHNAYYRTRPSFSRFGSDWLGRVARCAASAKAMVIPAIS